MSLAKTRHKLKTKTRKSKFQQLWEKAERIKQANVKLGLELDALANRIEQEVMPVELEMGAAIKATLEKQLHFAAKKSLTQWQRYELDRWISQTFDEISLLGLVDEELADKIADKHARDAGIVLDPHSTLSPAQQLDHYYQALEEESDADDELIDLLFGEFDEDDEEDNEPFPYDLFQDEDNPPPSGKQHSEQTRERLYEDFARAFGLDDEPPPSDTPARTIDSDVFKRLFRQTANALHPDKETDDTRRDEKHALMSSLLEARRNNDLITVIQLHKQFVDSEASLNSDDEKELINVLEHYLAQQQEEEHAIIHQSPIRASVYQTFYAKRQSTVDRKIDEHVRDIQSRTAVYEEFVGTVKTLKRLKDLLADRYDYYHTRPVLFDYDR